MSEFKFDPNITFDANLDAFLSEMETTDKDMAAILRCNIDKLAAVVRQGNRSGTARADFNAEIMRALDALLESPAKRA